MLLLLTTTTTCSVPKRPYWHSSWRATFIFLSMSIAVRFMPHTIISSRFCRQPSLVIIIIWGVLPGHTSDFLNRLLWLVGDWRKISKETCRLIIEVADQFTFFQLGMTWNTGGESFPVHILSFVPQCSILGLRPWKTATIFSLTDLFSHFVHFQWLEVISVQRRRLILVSYYWQMPKSVGLKRENVWRGTVFVCKSFVSSPRGEHYWSTDVWNFTKQTGPMDWMFAGFVWLGPVWSHSMPLPAIGAHFFLSGGNLR